MVMFWVSLLAVSILLYVLLDGVDLGVGLLFGLTNSEARRGAMLNAVAPIWDGNETWLVVTAVILWGAFPLAYATLLSAFYLPVIAMLLGLILRGVAFEFRYKTHRARWIWDLSFAGGSLLATFIQGMTVGALVEGLQFTNGEYSGGEVGWLTPFAVLCGIGLCLGYALLGACWLVRKCEAEVRDVARRQIPLLAVGVLAFLTVVFAYALAEHLPILQRWLDRPYLFVFPPIGAVAATVHRKPQRLLAVLYGHADLHIGIRHPGALLLAIYDPLRYHRRPGRRAAVQSRVHVLGWRRCLPADAALHACQLQRLQGQDRNNIRIRTPLSFK
jgi:cytochrome d ubiquinol oxidase subunit II